MMKNLILFATLLIFILNISDTAVISAEAKDDEGHDPVLDLDGNPLKTGTPYYVFSTFRPGGGVTIYPTANKTFGVAQLVFGDGLPVTFSNGGTDQGEVVLESTDLTIAFSFGILPFSTEWKVDKYDEVAKQYFVTAGDFDGDETSINRWFQIRKTSLGDYRFVFCPKLACEFCAQICTDVGIYLYQGVRRFALDGNFRSSTVAFRKFQR